MSTVQRTIGPVSSRWLLSPWHSGDASGDAKAFSDRHAVSVWLQQFRSDPAAVASLRAVVSEHSHAGTAHAHRSNDQILEDVSWLIRNGVVQVYRVTPPATAFPNAQHAPPAEKAPLPPSLSKPAPPKAPPKVSPTIEIAAPGIVLVKRAYQTKAHRLAVKLGTTDSFAGTGVLSSAQSASIHVFDHEHGGTPLALPLNLTAAQLTASRTVYVEAVGPSAALNDTVLSFKITGGPKTIVNSPVTQSLTRVQVQLDLCKYKPATGGADPAPLSDADKTGPGRSIHLQDARRYAGRCLLIVHQAQPAAYTGNLVLVARNKGVRVFSYMQEVPTSGEAASLSLPFSIANAKIPSGALKLWVEGANVSTALADSGFTLEISDLPHVEGDCAKITVVKTQIDVCQSRTAAGTAPKPIADADKMSKGRYLHVQDTGNHHGRACAIVHRVEPAAFTGQVETVVWDVTAKGTANPRLGLFADELPGAAAALANPYDVNFPAGFPAGKPLTVWVQGGKLSAALRDTELRLRVKDAEGWMDHAALTVCEFSALKADIPSTPAVTNRSGNSPVARHAWAVADPNPLPKAFDEDYATNLPMVLIENSVTAPDPVKLSVVVKPPGVPVHWSVIRDRRAAPNGDDPKVIALAGNKEAPSLSKPGETLTNTLLADAVGSFHICPYVDCNGSTKLDFMANDGTRIDREPFVMMNLILVRVSAVQNDSKGRLNNCHSILSPNAVLTRANFRGFSTDTSGGAWTGPTSGWHAKAKVDVIGGGSDGRRGLDRVFGGWIQHIFLNGIRSDYVMPAPPPPPPPAVAAPPPPPRSHQYAFVANLPDNTHYGQYHYIKAAEVALSPADATICIAGNPTLDASPILDVSPRAAPGTGGDSPVGSAGAEGGTTGNHGGGYAAPVNRPIGQRWEREMWDAPGIGCRGKHISAGGTLSGFRFNLGFRTDLCFWTSHDGKPDASANGVANRLYASVYICTWQPDFQVAFDAAGVGNVTIAKSIPVTKKQSSADGRAAPVDSSGLETRAPFALGWYAVDARN